MELKWLCPSVSLAVTVFSPSLCPSVSKLFTVSNQQRDMFAVHSSLPYVKKKSPFVARDTSLKSPCRLIEFVYEAFIHCQTFDTEESQVFPRQSFSKVNTGPDMHAHAQKHTHSTIQRRGVWDIPQTASCSR